MAAPWPTTSSGGWPTSRSTAYPEPWTRTLTRWLARHRTGVTAAGAAVLAALIGLAAVLGVQRQSNAVLAAKNNDLDRANVSLREAIVQKDAANTALGEANGRVQARFDLAREAIRSFKAGVEEEEALKEDRLRPLRDKLLGSARRFYDRLGDLLRGQDDAASKAILAESYMELGELIDKIGQKPEALEAFKKAVAIRRELAAAPGAGASERVALAKALNGLGEEAYQLGDHAAALAAHEEAGALAEPLADGPERDDRGPPGARGCPPRCRRGPRGDREGRRRAGGLPPGARRCARPSPATLRPSPTTAATWPTATSGSASCSRRPATWPGHWPSSGSARSCSGPWPPSTPPSPNTASDLAVSHNRVGSLLEKTGDRPGHWPSSGSTRS